MVDPLAAAYTPENAAFLARAALLAYAPDGQIEAVRIGASCRGLGVGEQLIRHAIDLARAEGCGLVQLTGKSRDAAHRFYERLGFVASHVGMKLELG